MSSKNEKTHNRILQSCWDLLEENSSNSVRMSDIAKKSGVSRQAVYLHFPNRAELLIATTKYIDDVKNIDARFAESRAAKGQARLNAFITAWCNYIPEIYGVAKALMAMHETDSEASSAWDGRMHAVRHGCEAAVTALEKENKLRAALTHNKAVDILWTLLSVRHWEHLTQDCKWSQADYLDHIQSLAHSALVDD